jgi:uncharacterized membrane protein YqjE
MDSGILASALRFTGSVTRHLEALAALFREELGEASACALRLLVYLFLGLLFVSFGYVFVVLFVAFLLAWVLEISWIWIALGFAVAHFVLAFVCALQIREGISRKWFEATTAEIQKDFATLRGDKPASPTTSLDP